MKLDILDKLEKVREGNNYLDREVFKALGWRYVPPFRRGARFTKGYWVKGKQELSETPPPITLDRDISSEFVRDGFEYDKKFDPTTLEHCISIDGRDYQAQTEALANCIVAIHQYRQITGNL